MLTLCAMAALSAVHCQFITLNNGVKMPVASFGTHVYHDNDNTAAYLTGLALQGGFRNIFASVMSKNQAGVARAIQTSNVSREELFVCGSVSTPNCGANCAAASRAMCAQNLRDLQLDYLDMIMLDFAMGTCEQILGQWRGVTDMLASGKTRSVAVSNFSPQQLDCIVQNKSNIVPAVNQVQFSVGHGTDPTLRDNAARGVIVQAWSPLASGRATQDADVIRIAKVHNRSAAQVALRWIVQSNASFTTDPGSYDLFYHQDSHIFDFMLTGEEMSVLSAKTTAV